MKIYSLSKQLKSLNAKLAKNIEVITLDELLHRVDKKQPINVLFEERHILEVLKIASIREFQETRFICVGKNMSSEDRLILLNTNIEYITPAKYRETNEYFFNADCDRKLLKVLFVDDDEDQALIIESILNKANMAVKTITKGEEVLETLDYFEPDLILMDLYLDGITGDKLVMIIRKEPRYRLLPIVFLTSDTTIESRMRVLNAGADDLITKPINSELLVSVLKNRMLRNCIADIQPHNKAQATDLNASNQTISHVEPTPEVVHQVEAAEEDLESFLQSNTDNNEAAIIWLKISNKHELQSKIGFYGFNSLADKMFASLPNLESDFELKMRLADGIFALASKTIGHEGATKWTQALQKWLAKNHFSLKGKDYFFKANAIILSSIPEKSDKELLLESAENLLIEPVDDAILTYIGQGVEEKQFNSIKNQIEDAIKTRNFQWNYQTIISTADENQEIYQLMLKINTKSGKELISKDYLDTAIKTGLIKVLDRFTLEHAIRIIRDGEQKGVQSRVLLNQVLADYASDNIRQQKLDIVARLNLPKDSMIFQFTHQDALEHKSVLRDVGRALSQANIISCLSNFDCTPTAWNTARKMNVKWIRIRLFDKDDPILSPENPNNLAKIVRKAHVLGYKVMVSKVVNAALAADLWKLKVDFLQGNFIQEPVQQI